MKYVILQGDGMIGTPQQELGGKTPLQVAATPNLDFLATHGEFGIVGLPNEGMAPTSDVVQLATLGFDPHKYHVGPAPFEAASLGVVLGEQDVAYLCNLVTVRPTTERGELKKLGSHVVLEDETAGGITTEEARELIDVINEELGSEVIQFYVGTGFRHVMVWVGGKARITCADPHDLLGKAIDGFLPTGEGANVLRELMEASLLLLRNHPVNEQRQENGLKPANCLWLWGPGKSVQLLPSVADRFHVSGALVSPKDLQLGIGMTAGLEAVKVEENEESRAKLFQELTRTALTELERRDLVYLHVPLPLEESDGLPHPAVEAIERFDHEAVGPLLAELPRFGPHRLLMISHVPSPHGRVSASGPLAYALYEGPSHHPANTGSGYNETDAEKTGVRVHDPGKLIGRLMATA